ncbi:hypothetical protein IWW36_003040 [Coemansia brasiliensis]|uniref:DH domain-containing protein n=1 Tax=Coemansia brasiliensis TaxID=2650707 RepID=A0A9W8LXL1_9FUNG|nr:hypothetical protein IWW36_003040 [Coemansia brasiliensis]
MAKSKVLVKATKTVSDDQPARPRTAAGDRSLLRRFRLGRIFFGSGADSSDSPPRRGSQSILRTNSVQAPAPDVPHMPAQPLPAYNTPHNIHTIVTHPRPPTHANVSADARKSHYSVMSRRSSAPDIAEMTRRLSRHMDTNHLVGTDVDEMPTVSTRRNPQISASVLPSHKPAVYSNHDDDVSWLHAADAQSCTRSSGELAHSNRLQYIDTSESDDCVFVPLSSTATGRPSPAFVSASNTPNMTHATLVWKEPRSESQTASSPSLPDSAPLPPGSPKLYSQTTSTASHSSEHVHSSNEDNATADTSRHSQQSAPHASSPLPDLPTLELPTTPLSARPSNKRHFYPLRRPKASTSDCWVSSQVPPQRPKSLYERPSSRALAALHSRHDAASPTRTSSSIASAKAFLMMIASGNGHADAASASPALSIITSPHIEADSPTMSVPASAPVGKSESAGTFDEQSTSNNCRTPLNFERATSEKPLEGFGLSFPSPSTSPGTTGNRSLRTRSRLAGAGIRRASTYVWGRSSVFIKALSSTEELPGSTLQQQQQALTGTCESDMDTGSTKTDDASSFKGPLALSTSAAHKREPTPEPATGFVAPVHISKKSPAAMRLHAARELVMTEKNFVDNLFVIKKVWMEPVFSSANSPKPIIPYQAARVIFFGIAALHAHASHFYRDMDFALGSYERGHGPAEGREDDGMRIGALFRANDRHWSDFIAYVRNYGAAVNCLKQLQDYKPYLRYHEECMMQKRTNRQSLKDLLMLPIQRITRYTLLLKNILKHTPAVHSDHIDLCRAVKNVTHFATIVNECRRKQEEMQRVVEKLKTVENCPAFPHVEARSFIAEFFVRELISRLPTRLLLFSDLLLVAQAPAQAAIDDIGNVLTDVTWTYYGFAVLDEVEVQNADESTSTLITILSLNRHATTDVSETSRPSLPLGTEPSVANSSTASEQRGHNYSFGCHNNVDAPDIHGRSSGASHHEPSVFDAALPDHSTSKKKKTKSRRGILHAGSRESVDHATALSHSTFPSPVPAPGQLERSQSRLHSGSPASTGESLVDRDSHLHLLQRPKTASAAGILGGSNSTLGSHGGSALLGDTPLPLRTHQLESHSFTPSSTSSTIAPGRAEAAPRPPQLTLVMQHATSDMRKQFVRALKEATTTLINEALGLGDSDAACGHPFGDSSSEVLNLHPL